MDILKSERKKLWEQIYAKPPLAAPVSPAAVPVSVEWFINLTRRYANTPPETQHLLDLGCGTGRIALHLARRGYHVTGYDFVPAALAQYQRSAEQSKLHEKMVCVEQDIVPTWPARDRAFNHALAITVIDNFTEKTDQEHFFSEASRVLMPSGLLVVEFHTHADEYYGPYLEQSVRKDSGILFDPATSLTVKLYSKEEIAALSKKYFSVFFEREGLWAETRDGQTYKRRSYLMFLKKNDKT